MLKELIIIGNPLVSMQRGGRYDSRNIMESASNFNLIFIHAGLPQILQNELVDKGNINIVRYVTTSLICNTSHYK